METEPHNEGERERIVGRPAFGVGESEAIIDLYEVPAVANEARFKAEFEYAGREWKIDFRGNQTFPL